MYHGGIKYWGPRLWYIIHKLCNDFPSNPTLSQKQNYMAFFNLTSYIIPCMLCRVHYSDALRTRKLHTHLDDRNQLIDWFRILHNNVNISHKRKLYEIEELAEIYNKPFNHTPIKELLDYFYLIMIEGEIDRENLIKWILLFFKLYECNKCKSTMSEYFRINTIHKIKYHNNILLKNWIDGIKLSIC